MKTSRGVSLPSMASTCDTCGRPEDNAGDVSRDSEFVELTSGSSKVTSLLRHVYSYLRDSKFTMCRKRYTVFLVVLLNFLVVGATPTHRVRHRLYRNSLDADHLCESPGAIDQPTQDQCQPRVRRDINAMTLREAQTNSLCSYSVCVDEDPARRPVHIHRVHCLQSGCRCTQEGAYRCTQLYNKVEVWYPASNSSQWKDVEYGCVCAAKHAATVEPFVPDTGDK